MSFETPDGINRRTQGPRFAPGFMRVLELSRDLACLCVDGTIIDCNSAAAAILGAEAPQHLFHQPFSDYVPDDYAPVVDALLRLHVLEHEPVPVRLTKRNGRPVEAELTIHPARELGPGHTVVMARDISREGHLARSARDSEVRFRQLVDHSMHMICQCWGSQVVYMNQAGVRMLGGDAALGQGGWQVAEMFAPEYRELFRASPQTLLAERDMLPVRLVRADGVLVNAQIMVTPLPLSGQVPEYMIEARDIGPQIRAVSALRHMNDKLEQKVIERTRELDAERENAVTARRVIEGLLEAVPSPLWWKDPDGRYLGYNRAFREVHGLSGGEWLGRTLAEMLPGNPVAEVSSQADGEAMRQSRRVEYEAHIADADGQGRDVVIGKIAYRNARGTPQGVIGVMLDITERKRMEAELRRMATTDSLTGAFNRRYLLSTAQLEVERSRRYGRPLSALMLDIDYFKRINDNFGHPVGDEAIKAFASACKSVLRAEDSLGRLGGEEFAILLPETDADAAMAAGERLRQAIADLCLNTSQGPVRFTTSIGVAELRPGDLSEESLLSRADEALYAAKASGRNKVMAAAAG